MTVVTEGNLQLTVPPGVEVRKFDDQKAHGLSHCMKAVDFIVELKDRYWFIEFKDPQHPEATAARRDKWINTFFSGKLDKELAQKYRDSFLYEWAAKRKEKPVYYFFLIGLDSLDHANLLARTDALKRKIPLQGPPSGAWKRRIVKGCAVFNIETWNKYMENFPVQRIS